MVSEFCANYLPQYMITCSQRGKTLGKGGVWREYARGLGGAGGKRRTSFELQG